MEKCPSTTKVHLGFFHPIIGSNSTCLKTRLMLEVISKSSGQLLDVMRRVELLSSHILSSLESTEIDVLAT